jgi:hypothetical protein
METTNPSPFTRLSRAVDLTQSVLAVCLLCAFAASFYAEKINRWLGYRIVYRDFVEWPAEDYAKISAACEQAMAMKPFTADPELKKNPWLQGSPAMRGDSPLLPDVLRGLKATAVEKCKDSLIIHFGLGRSSWAIIFEKKVNERGVVASILSSANEQGPVLRYRSDNQRVEFRGMGWFWEKVWDIVFMALFIFPWRKLWRNTRLSSGAYRGPFLRIILVLVTGGWLAFLILLNCLRYVDTMLF